MRELRIGNITVPLPAGLAPMAGVTDLPFRRLCREMGCGLFYTEMVSAKALHYGNKNTAELLVTEPAETPLAVQLFGSEPEIMAEAAERLAEDPAFDIIDVNMGCPVPKVVKNGEGSALMEDPALAGKIVAAMVRRCARPVTVKFRLGFTRDHVNAAEFAKVLEDAGAAALAVHGRTRDMFYSGRADWEEIARVKAAVKIPVLGNGDIFSGADARRRMEESGVDGVLIARGAKGNPWIFREAAAALAGEEIPARPAPREIGDVLLRHFRDLAALKGERVAVREMRSHAAWYTAGLPESSRLRGSLNTAESAEELEALLAGYFAEIA
ncbi:MAG: tRNA dihydrouridine synthase DusB [Lachnospiraceae bacterium]|nr:tRNA dihydrouridine synthase DusB [Lachnospiraceae bacterium]